MAGVRTGQGRGGVVVKKRLTPHLGTGAASVLLPRMVDELSLLYLWWLRQTASDHVIPQRLFGGLGCGGNCGVFRLCHADGDLLRAFARGRFAGQLPPVNLRLLAHSGSASQLTSSASFTRHPPPTSSAT